jgi:DNA polymerase-1
VPKKGDGRKLRKAFTASPGKVLIDADFSQLELRLLAHFSGDPILLKAYINGEDIHQKTADLVGCNRDLGKALNFGLGYGAGANRFSKEVYKNTGGKIKLSIKKSEELIEGYFRAYSILAKYQESERRRINKERYVRLPISKRIRHGFYAPEDDIKNGRVFREIFNSNVQGTGAELTLISMRNFKRIRDERIKKDLRWSEVKLLLQVHDELVFEAPKIIAEEVASEVGKIMSGATRGFRVPITADAKIGDNWMECH